MGTVPRPIKARGNANFADEVAAGKPDILDVEVDRDFNALYTLVNGNLDTANIKASGANIQYGQLNLTGKIQPGDLAPGFVLPANAVIGTSIQDHTIAGVKLVPGAATGAQVLRGDDSASVLAAGETLLVELTWNTVGGYWVATASVVGFITAVPPTTTTLTLRLGGTAGLTDGTPVHTAQLQSAGAPGSGSLPFGVALLTQGNFLLGDMTNPKRLSVTATTTASPAGAIGITSRRLLLHEAT
jgi:hypothetical protein